MLFEKQVMPEALGSPVYNLFFVLLTLCLEVGFALALRRANGGRLPLKIFSLQLAWTAGAGGLAYLGFLRDFQSLPPRAMLVVLPTFALTAVLAFSPLGKRLSQLPLSWLVGFQAFRIPVELLLHQGYAGGFVPRELTFVGHNFDIATGILAVPLALWLRGAGAKHAQARRLALGFTGLGLALLAVVVTTAVLAMPTPFQVLHTRPANVWIAELPYVWLPVVMVPAALLGHLLVLRRLLSKQPLAQALA